MEPVGGSASQFTRDATSPLASKSSGSPTTTVFVSGTISSTNRLRPAATPEALPLADREAVDAVVLAEHRAVLLDDHARGRDLRPPRAHHVGVVAARHEANLDAVRLVRDAEQPRLAGQRADLRLRVAADREEQVRQHLALMPCRT